MDSQFWIKAWDEGKTNFHQTEYNDQVQKYFPRLNPKEGQRVLVPLCGKSKDLLWLHGLKVHVHGLELYDDVVKSFFSENELSPVKETQDQFFRNYTHKNLVVSSGDFFKLHEKEAYDFIYDRASLVALPASMRISYAQVIKHSLKKGGKCLLIVYEYDQSKLDGPPFSVDADEIHELYEDAFSIELVESKQPSNAGPRLSSLENGLKQKVYILEKL
ncbi:MAG TPA: thiopurine S-methyltransferase [Bacteriovoracaceae bacterium]|nr:thiopurine S-methyltransferase [Bacteriovoracaceae bacterium]